MKKMLPYDMKFLVPIYSCLQNPWLGGYRPPHPDPRSLCRLSSTEFVEHPPEKIPGYATDRFTREKEHRYPLNRSLCGRQIRSGRFGEKSIAPTGIRTLDHPARNLVTIPTAGGVTMNEDKRRSDQKVCPHAHPTVTSGVQADYCGPVCRAK